MNDTSKGLHSAEPAPSRRAFMGSVTAAGLGLGLGLAGARRPGHAQGRAKILKFGSLGTDIHPATISARTFAEAVGKGTSGAIEVQVFPNAQLGGEREVAEGMLRLRPGDVHDAGRSGNWVPEGQLSSFPSCSVTTSTRSAS